MLVLSGVKANPIVSEIKGFDIQKISLGYNYSIFTDSTFVNTFNLNNKAVFLVLNDDIRSIFDACYHCLLEANTLVELYDKVLAVNEYIFVLDIVDWVGLGKEDKQYYCTYIPYSNIGLSIPSLRKYVIDELLNTF